MPKLATFCLVLIAGILSVRIFLDRIVPTVALKVYHGDYEQLVIDCEQARESWRTFAQGMTGDNKTDDLLRHSARVQLLNCLNEESLRNKLVSWGVPEASIRSIELDVISRSPGLPFDAKIP